MEEVPPAELTDELVGARVFARTRDDLERREAPEVEVRAEPRRSVDIEPIPPLGVRLQPVGEPARETPAPFALAASSDAGRRCPTGQLTRRRELRRRDTRREAQPFRSAQRLPPAAPRASVASTA